MSKQDELDIIDRLKKLYPHFPSGKLDHIDSPDFIATDNSQRKIGIELTQAVHSEEAKSYSSEKKAFTDLVLAKLVTLLPFHFSISVELATEIGIRKVERDTIASQVAMFCATEFSTLQNTKYSSVDHVEVDLINSPEYIKNYLIIRGFRNLPLGIKSISVFRYDEHGSSFNAQSEAAFIPFFSKEKLQERLEVKEFKLKSYKPCDEYWLVIWQGGGITGYFKEDQIETPIKSKFDKVFIVRTFENDLIILKP